MLKLLDGATIRQDTKRRIEMFLVFVEDALSDGNLFDGQRKMRSIMGKLNRFERQTKGGDR
jgi:hypothetical protein